MALLLRNRDIVGLMGVREYIDAVEEGYREVGLGRGVNFPRHNLWLDGARFHLAETERPRPRAGLKFKAALLSGLGVAGVQAYTTVMGVHTYTYLFSIDSGRLICILEALYYDWLKTAAVAALATRYLAPEKASTVAIFGTGRHARSQLHGLCEILPVRRVQAYSRDPKRRRAFCEAMAAELGIDVVPCSTPGETLRNAECITTITTSTTPVFDGKMLEDRPTHINAMGAHNPWAREVDEHVVLRSRVVVDERQQALKEKGEIIIPIENGLMEASDIHCDLAELVAGKAVGREPEVHWTLFLSGGTAIEDIAVAFRLYKRAREKGVGIEVELNQSFDWEIPLERGEQFDAY